MIGRKFAKFAYDVTELFPYASATVTWWIAMPPQKLIRFHNNVP